ncbi:MAG: molecular chaperone [Evtepia sp.]|jgi:tRNA threonylcarbamoyladenosine biosynthesis protein TsaB|nr:molecular chaperone [Evtepia sp.]
MKILALESSAVAASVAVCENETLIAQSFQKTGLTHSQTLLPMLEGLLSSCGLSLNEIDLIGVSSGPGSFTGLRIGVSLAKGLAWAKEIPCAACSTLESMAWNAVAMEGEICTAMDARRGQIYNARFCSNGETICRLTPDRAIALEDLTRELQGTNKIQLLVGDGADLCYEHLQKSGVPARLAPPNLRLQSAWGVARVALELSRKGEAVSSSMLKPTYLRLSQAERERLEREQESSKENEGN